MAERALARPLGPLRKGVLALILAWVSLLLIVPLVALVTQVVTHAGEVVRALTEPATLHAMGLSVVLAAIALAVNGVLGVIGALVIVRQRFFGRRLLDALVDLPLAVSPVMIGLAFLLTFGRNGWLYPLLDALDLKIAFAFPGLVVATLFVTLPFTVREVALVLAEVGTSEEESAATLGASPWQTFWQITFPNVRHGLTTGATLTVARALGEFGAVLVLGGAVSGRTQTATTYIHVAMEDRQVAGAYGMALLLAAAATLLLAVLQRPHGAKGRS